MKRLLIMLGIILVMLPAIASAHTHLESSTPVSGEVVTEHLNKIVLNFGGEIESLSTMTLVKDDQKIPFKSVEPQGTQMVGVFKAPPENGSYVIKWKIIGEDGHVITGEIPFSVQVEQDAGETGKEELITENPNNKEGTDPAVNEEGEVRQKDTANQKESNNEQSESNLTKIVIPVVVVLLLSVGLAILFIRKK
ncbi:copper resistance CopC family protein [Jeotgalibacillus proteolyticus]|uniref:CopC domain-containing protein n=1 Tax=Jeotgalibacillus proteolyticus TaxID=2082395 RepID=A0A2S5G925_9BACL|nr:copper resistance protein CopC [Jeotgalibacillus proteolyticus]PPA69414.1 hypothetical protein C4B60_16645 [Jeotgalibacillus proteolyticus]